MICPQYYPILGGYEKSAEHLTELLIQRGHSVSVSTRRINRQVPKIQSYRSHTIIRWWFINKRFICTFSSCIGFTMFLLRHGWKYDVWHIHQYGYEAVICGLFSFLFKKATILKTTSQNTLVNFMKQRKYNPLIAFGISRIDSIFCASNRMMDELSKSEFQFKNICILSNGIGNEYFDRCKVHSKCDVISIVLISRLEPVKQVKKVLESLNVLFTHDIKFIINVVGDGPCIGALKDFKKNSPYGSNIYLLGSQDNIPEILINSDIFVQFSLREGLSNSMLEAMAAGLGIIVSNVSGVEENIVKVNGGYSVDARNKLTLESALLKMAQNVCLRQEMGKNAHIQAWQNYRPEIVAQRVLNQYKLSIQQLK